MRVRLGQGRRLDKARLASGRASPRLDGDPEEMSMKLATPAAAALILLAAACDVNVGDTPGKAPQSAEAPAPGKAEEGRFSIKAPGFDMKVNIPEGLSRHANMEADNNVLPPNAQLSGMHVEAGADGKKGGGGAELRFTSADDVAKVASWYRDPARAKEFTIAAAKREGQAVAMTGTQQDGNGSFDLRLTPKAGGGTDGTLMLREGN
jgi:hypothetical protein